MPELPSSPSGAVRKRNPHLYAGASTERRAAEPELKTDLVTAKTTVEEKLNKLERAWLQQLRLTHPEVHVQDLTLRLAHDTRYTVDFWVIDANGQLVCYETKGHMRDDARVKIYVAARMFRHFRFILVTRDKNGWHELPVAP